MTVALPHLRGIRQLHANSLDFYIDAPELAQKCLAGPRAVRDCGKASADALYRQIGGAPVLCVSTERDAYDRLLAHCSVNGMDLSAWSAASGWS